MSDPLICKYCQQDKGRSIMTGQQTDPLGHECFSDLLKDEIDLLRYKLMEIRGMIRPIITNSQQILIEATETKTAKEDI